MRLTSDTLAMQGAPMQHDKRLTMAPAGAERWYDGEPKRERGQYFKRSSLQTSLWLIRIVLLAPQFEIYHNE